ncbi:MAG: hypothetical protein RL258_16, partial [Pseudomonadota bacterium]
LSRLKYQDYAAAEVARLAEQLGARQEHSRMAIVATGVHLSDIGTGMGEEVFLCHRQGIHVGPKAHRPGARLPAPNDADHARAADAFVDLIDAQGAELFGHQGGRAKFFKLQFWMRVDVAADPGEGLL